MAHEFDRRDLCRVGDRLDDELGQLRPGRYFVSLDQLTSKPSGIVALKQLSRRELVQCARGLESAGPSYAPGCGRVVDWWGLHRVTGEADDRTGGEMSSVSGPQAWIESTGACPYWEGR
jgi:hypothetical protein